MSTSFLLPLLVGLTSASGFAVANSLQHQVAGTVPADVRRPAAVLGHLARRPLWLTASVLSFLSMVCHAVALRLGSIALVQPLMLVGVVLAVPLRAALEHQRPPWPAVRAVGLTVAGLAAYLSVADLQETAASPDLRSAAALVLLGVALAAVLATASGARLPAPVQATVLGVAAGVAFGVTAGLLKLVGTVLTSDASLAWRAAALTALVLVGLLGTALNQKAYQLAPIAFSMPMVNVTDITVALVFGGLVFGELPGHSPAGLLLQVGSLVLVVCGLRGIARLDVVCPRPRTTVTS